MKLVIDATSAVDLMKFATTEETRYYLQGFHVENREGEIFCVTTDGHRMLIVKPEKAFYEVDPKGSDNGPIKISKDLIARAKKEVKDAEKVQFKKVVLVVTGDMTGNGAVLMRVGDEDTHEEILAEAEKGVKSKQFLTMENSAIIDGKYPDWSRVLPDFDLIQGSSGASSYNSKYIAQFGELASNGSVRIISKDPSSPAWIQFQGKENYLGVLMPVRFSYENNSVLTSIRPDLKAAT